MRHYKVHNSQTFSFYFYLQITIFRNFAHEIYYSYVKEVPDFSSCGSDVFTNQNEFFVCSYLVYLKLQQNLKFKKEWLKQFKHIAFTKYILPNFPKPPTILHNFYMYRCEIADIGGFAMIKKRQKNIVVVI